MAEEKTTELTIIDPKSVDLTIPEEFEMNGLRISRQIIQDKIAQVKLMTINGIGDKTGYDLAVKEKSACVKLRTQSEAWRKEKVKPINDALDELKDTIAGFGAEAKIGEDYLAGIIAPIDNAKAKIKLDKENEKLRVMQDRITSLIQFGALLDGGYYKFPYNPILVVSIAQVKDLKDKEFKSFLSDVHDAWETEQKCIEDEKKAAALEKENNIKIAVQVKVSQAALKEKQTNLRIKELKLMEFTDSVEKDLPVYFHVSNQSASWVSQDIIENCTYEEWEDLIQTLTDGIVNGWVKDYPVEEVVSRTFPDGSPSSGRASQESIFSDIPKSVTSTLSFNAQDMYIDSPVSDKFFLRFYPDEYSHIGNMNRLAHAASGKVDGNLNFILIKK